MLGQKPRGRVHKDIANDVFVMELHSCLNSIQLEWIASSLVKDRGLSALGRNLRLVLVLFRADYQALNAVSTHWRVKNSCGKLLINKTEQGENVVRQHTALRR